MARWGTVGQRPRRTRSKRDRCLGLSSLFSSQRTRAAARVLCFAGPACRGAACGFGNMRESVALTRAGPPPTARGGLKLGVGGARRRDRWL